MKTYFLDFQVSKEKLFMVLTLSVVGFFFSLVMGIGSKSSLLSKNPPAAEGVNYKMVHVDDGYAGYSLSDREVDYQYEALKKKQAAEKNVIPGRIQVPAAKKVNNIKKTNNKTAKQKAEEAKKDQARKEILEKALIEHAKQEEARKMHEATMASQAPAYQANQAEVQDVNTQDTTKKNRKSFSEWRALIYASPTQDTMKKFIEAFRAGEVSQEDYQSMAQDLLDQSDDKYKGLGLMALRAYPSLNSLSQMVHAENSLSTSLKTYVQQGYNSYLQGQNVAILNQALKTSDKVLIKRTLTLLQTGLTQINSGNISGLVSGNRTRGSQSSDLTSTFSVTNFKILLTALSTLTSNSDSQIASLAQQVSGQITTTNNIAGI